MKKIDESLIKKGEAIEKVVEPQFKSVDRIREKNFLKVLNAFQTALLHDSDFGFTSGYGYNDIGREKVEAIFANIFKAEAAIVRPQIVSGTHAISITLFGLLKPNDTLVYASGRPYETGEGIIGIRDIKGSLKDLGIKYAQFDFREGFNEHLIEQARVVAFQRSKGYTFKDSITIPQLKEAIVKIREINPKAIIFVDNCYGEFVEEHEPTEVGADVVVGSLIKNAGGAIAFTGGYVVGREEQINSIASRLTAPGVGKEIGPMLGLTRNILQGIFFAPLVVSNALKGAIFASKLFEDEGFEVKPRYTDKRGDIVQAIKFGNKELLIAFAQAIQNFSPVDSDALIEPSPLAGYSNKILMASGSFIQGSSIELSFDAPLKPPYVGYLQGGVYYEHVKYASLYGLNYIRKFKSK